jgi:hypothetical protein
MPCIAQKLEFVAVKAVATVGEQMNQGDGGRDQKQYRHFGPVLCVALRGTRFSLD